MDAQLHGYFAGPTVRPAGERSRITGCTLGPQMRRSPPDTDRASYAGLWMDRPVSGSPNGPDRVQAVPECLGAWKSGGNGRPGTRAAGEPHDHSARCFENKPSPRPRFHRGHPSPIGRGVRGEGYHPPFSSAGGVAPARDDPGGHHQSLAGREYAQPGLRHRWALTVDYLRLLALA